MALLTTTSLRARFLLRASLGFGLVTIALASVACRPPRNRYDWRTPAGEPRPCRTDADCPSGQCVMSAAPSAGDTAIGDDDAPGSPPSTPQQPLPMTGTCSGGSGSPGSLGGDSNGGPYTPDGGASPRHPRPHGQDPHAPPAPTVQPSPGDIQI